MRTILKGLLQCINKQDFSYPLSSKLDTSCQSAQQRRGNFLHSRQLPGNFPGNLV